MTPVAWVGEASSPSPLCVAINNAYAAGVAVWADNSPSLRPCMVFPVPREDEGTLRRIELGVDAAHLWEQDPVTRFWVSVEAWFLRRARKRLCHTGECEPAEGVAS